MDLLLIFRKLWRHKLATLPVIALTLAGVVYVVAVKEPVYEASSSYVLINPPAPPTQEEIARDPALGRVNADNPYTRFADQGVVIDVLSRTVGSDSARQKLVQAGADRGYTVASAAHFGTSSPIVQITGMGPTAQAAMRTATVVGRAVVAELDRMQRVQHIDAKYRITASQVDVPEKAQLRATGQIRMLVGVLALGVIMLFIVVSVTDALDTMRLERMQRATLAGLAPVYPKRGQALPTADDHDAPLNGADRLGADPASTHSPSSRRA